MEADSVTMEKINDNLKRIADALETISKCVDKTNNSFCIEGEVGAYETSSY